MEATPPIVPDPTSDWTQAYNQPTFSFSRLCQIYPVYYQDICNYCFKCNPAFLSLDNVLIFFLVKIECKIVEIMHSYFFKVLFNGFKVLVNSC